MYIPAPLPHSWRWTKVILKDNTTPPPASSSSFQNNGDLYNFLVQSRSNGSLSNPCSHFWVLRALAVPPLDGIVWGVPRLFLSFSCPFFAWESRQSWRPSLGIDHWGDVCSTLPNRLLRCGSGRSHAFDVRRHATRR